jgi:hypothetical protein
MKDSLQILIIGFSIIIIGLVLTGAAASISVPSAYNTFLGIPYSVNPEFVSSLNEKLELFFFGFLFLGFGIEVSSTIGYILKLEKKVSKIPPPPPT